MKSIWIDSEKKLPKSGAIVIGYHWEDEMPAFVKFHNVYGWQGLNETKEFLVTTSCSHWIDAGDLTSNLPELP